jgi:hypothetical protein
MEQVSEINYEDILLLNIFPSGVAKELCSTWSIRNSSGLLHDKIRCCGRVRPVLEEGLQRSRKHLLEADDHDTIGRTVADHISRHKQTSGTSRAVVVHVINGDLGHAELVEHALTAGGITVAVACYALLDIVVVDLCVQQGLNTGFETKFGVVYFSTGLDELGHANAEDVAVF